MLKYRRKNTFYSIEIDYFRTGIRTYMEERGKKWHALGWFLATVLSLSVIFGLFKANLGPLASQLYTTLARSAWATALAWVR